jgi:hypothetical protein
MFGIDRKIVASLPWAWRAAGGAAALVVALGVFVLRRAPNIRASAIDAVSRYGLIVGGALAVGCLAVAFVHTAALGDLGAERRTLESRAQQLAAPALAVGSPLACLDGVASDTVQAACEKAVFASPASVAASIAYVTARFALLSDMADYAGRGGRGIDGTLKPLRRALEADPYGFLAYVLVIEDGCSSESCPALALLPHPDQVRTNLIAQTLQHYVEQYRKGWADLPSEAVAQPPGSKHAAMAEADTRRKVDIDFPSAASIPPISIMTPEPKTSPAAEAKRPGAARTDPVWTPAPTPLPPTATPPKAH